MSESVKWWCLGSPRIAGRKICPIIFKKQPNLTCSLSFKSPIPLQNLNKNRQKSPSRGAFSALLSLFLSPALFVVLLQENSTHNMTGKGGAVEIRDSGPEVITFFVFHKIQKENYFNFKLNSFIKKRFSHTIIIWHVQPYVFEQILL